MESVMWWEALWRLVGLLTDAGPTALLVGAAGLLLVTVLAAGLMIDFRSAANPLVSRSAMRDRARRAGVPRHRDPDAPGRTRPRGPTARPVAA
ncbi:hypothetical protein AMIS_48290 [Actinoplanes missouriensis 431]|uniref:Uncharacterized protein n=1 Tax=Actinoplanes missouriensis (strain ATCC 14538 / DSM 43046 / CBS 188.64 / JCM 3121 / NBRC 102363 / NCIMB 12654 / NRRL B-3342 / UNCC 431) TaxID=512565 RepID=I0HAL2_ACTM4|nr:DUF6412 domain-containing protein [Actinoplanes missouriensis]BAL90049.1 hypothetical protein AMIS_48290 [Actinoplanes missouriensis 431]